MLPCEPCFAWSADWSGTMSAFRTGDLRVYYTWCRSEKIALEGHRVGAKWNQESELNSTTCGAVV